MWPLRAGSVLGGGVFDSKTFRNALGSNPDQEWATWRPITMPTQPGAYRFTTTIAMNVQRQSQYLDFTVR
jgi:hypothetical protein